MFYKTKAKFSPYILKWLNLSSNQLYSIDNLKDAIIAKSGLSLESKNKNTYIDIPLDDEGKMLFNTNNPTIRLQTAITFIGQKYLINCNRPNCDFYEYNQEPKNVNYLDV